MRHAVKRVDREWLALGRISNGTFRRPPVVAKAGKPAH
jgi:hypothetical protein